MLGKINITRIIVDHLATLRSARTGKKRGGDAWLFIILPILTSGYFIFYEKYEFDSTYINLLIAALSILTGFLFNLLAIIFGFMDKLVTNANSDDIKKALVGEIHTNISFCIVVALTCIISLLLVDSQYVYLRYVFSFLAMTSSIIFFLSLLMILKRIYIIMSKELNP